jgi:flagellar assembly protein FliH
MNMSSDKNPAGSAVPLVETFHYPLAPTPGPGAGHAPELGVESFASDGQWTGEQLSVRISKAREEGIREGAQRERARLEQEIAEQKARIAEALAAFERERGEYYAKIETEVVHLAVAIASRILHREAQLDHMLLAALAKVALNKLQQNTRVRVRVAHQQGESWREYFAHDSQIAVAPEVVEDDSLSAWNCILETELGSTELGLEPQLKEIETGLFDLLAQRPDFPPQPAPARQTQASQEPRSKTGFVGEPGAR